MSQHVVVTGGAGYIGGFTAEALVNRGDKVTVIDNLSTGHRAAVPAGADFHHCDLLDLRRLSDIFGGLAKVDSVIHFAAKSQVGESMRDPVLYWDSNVTGTMNLVRAMRNANVERLVFSSTAAVYGDPIADLTEDHQKKPTNVYGNTKLAVETFLSDMSFTAGMRTIALRYFNASGASPDGTRGEAHDPETHLVPLAIGAALGVRPGLKVFGNDYPTRDGTAIRDYIDVSDLAAAHLLGVDATTDSSASPYRAYNVGTGVGASVLEVIAAVEEASGERVPYELAGRRSGDPTKLVANSARLQKELGWRPRVGLAEIVMNAVRWHRDNPKGYSA